MKRRLITRVSLAACFSARTVVSHKCLLIHGKGESGSKMVTQFAKTIAPALPEISFDAVTAPHPLNNQDEYQWWLLKPGERSFTASEYIGLDQSLDILREKTIAEGPFHSVWGHSQGAIFLAFLLARRDLFDSVFGALNPPSKFILNGAAWPQPFDQDMSSIALLDDLPSTLHCFATDDPVNPSEHARRIASLCKEATTYIHDGGHYVPDDPKAIAAYRHFLL